MKTQNVLRKRIKQLKEQLSDARFANALECEAHEHQIRTLNKELEKSFENFNRSKALVEKTEQANIHLNEQIRKMEMHMGGLIVTQERLEDHILNGIKNGNC